MQKKQFYVVLMPLFLLLFACGGANTTEQKEAAEKEATEIRQEDSLATEMDKIQAEIETKRAELEKALQDIEE